MNYPDIFKNLNFKVKNGEIHSQIKDFHSFCNLPFIEQFDQVLLCHPSDTISNAPHLWEALFITKDNLRASEILFHLNFFEQSSAQLRIAYEKLTRTMANIINCSVKKDRKKPERGINVNETLKKLATNLNLPSEKILDFYKKLSEPIHNPMTTFLDNSYEELPSSDLYNQKLCKARLLHFIKMCTELIIAFAGYHKIKINPRELTPLESICMPSLAGDEGFEPPMPRSERGALPLG